MRYSAYPHSKKASFHMQPQCTGVKFKTLHIARVHPNLIPIIGVIMVHFSIYARPCVHSIHVCKSDGGSMRALCYKKRFIQRDNIIK